LVTDPEFVSRADRLEKAVTSGDFKGFCEEKAHEATNARDKQMWSLMKVLFESVCILFNREAYLTYRTFRMPVRNSLLN
jgi:hypothetical protein